MTYRYFFHILQGFKVSIVEKKLNCLTVPGVKISFRPAGEVGSGELSNRPLDI